MNHRPALACFLAALLCAATGFAWQWLTVRYNHDGDWSALFLTGALFPVPPELASEHPRVFPGAGYDGQMYHYMAHDPFMRRGFDKSMDSARLRYRRILFPAMAYALAAGRDRAIDPSIVVLNLAFLFAGAWWTARYLMLLGRPAAWAILFVLVPAALISLDRLTVDLSLASLAMGFAYYIRIEARWRLFAILVLACLSRETGVALVLAWCAAEFARRRYLQAAINATALIPTMAWYLYVDSRTAPLPVQAWQFTPLRGYAERFLHPIHYPFSPRMNLLIVTADDVALAGVLAACALAFVWLRRERFGPMPITAAIWALGALLLPGEFLQDCCSSGRVLTPLAIFVALRAAESASLAWVLPLVMLSSRTWLQLLSPAWGVIKGLFNRS